MATNFINNHSIIPYSGYDFYDASKDFENALQRIELKHSLQNLADSENLSFENAIEAVMKALDLCHLAGIRECNHFRKIYMYDSTLKTLILDWLMSVNGLNLVIMQLPLVRKEEEGCIWLRSAL